MKVNKFIALPVVSLMAASCVTSAPKGAQQQRAVKSAIETPASWASKATQYADQSTKWLADFNDPMLLKLIAEGKANNLDLRAAAGNMDKAWLLAKKSGSSLKPKADLSFGKTQSGNMSGDPSVGKINVGLTVGWEADVWGRMRAGVRSAEADAQAAEADYVFAQHSLSANIAKTYFKAIEAKQQSDITRKNVAILQKTLRITKVKHDNGLSSGQDIALNRASLAAAQDQLIKLEGAERDALRGLEVLLGRYPRAGIDIANVLPTLPLQPPAGVPSSVLERRPDIISAERKIAAAFDATAQAKAARLPKFSLTSTLSGASDSLANILSPTNMAWQLAGNLLAPLLDGGKGEIDVEIASAEQEQAISNYTKAALQAFSEVETNLDQGDILTRREFALNEALTQSRKAQHIAEIRYKEGESELLDTLTIQQQSIAAQSNLLSIKRAQLEQRINLYLSLGGSWAS